MHGLHDIKYNKNEKCSEYKIVTIPGVHIIRQNLTLYTTQYQMHFFHLYINIYMRVQRHLYIQFMYFTMYIALCVCSVCIQQSADITSSGHEYIKSMRILGRDTKRILKEPIKSDHFQFNGP